jgi:hypothetical protein
MIQHTFIFHPGRWIGEGRVVFNSSQEKLHFYTRWTLEKADRMGVYCSQEVEMPGTENMLNNFFFTSITPTSFIVELENKNLGKVKGKGVIDDKRIAWEFHGQEKLEGFEVYERQENGDYMLHAEYVSMDQFRTIIDGRIWEKTENL